MELAIEQHKELENIVKEHKEKGVSFKELYILLDGWNLEDKEEYFDLNFGVMTVTIEKNNGKWLVLENGINIWDDENDALIEDDTDFKKIKEYLERESK